MAGELEHRYEVEVKKAEKKQGIPERVASELKASGMTDDKGKFKLKGVSPKMLKRMKQEYVDCPILGDGIHFVQCFVCPNFQSRVIGKVLCKGKDLQGPLQGQEPAGHLAQGA